MRTLTFLPGGGSHYALLHQATLFSQKQLSPQEFRTTAKLQSKLEAVGEVQPLGEGESAMKLGSETVEMYHCPNGGSVAFEEAEWKMLRELFESTRFQTALAKKVAGVLELLDATQQEEVKPTLKVE